MSSRGKWVTTKLDDVKPKRTKQQQEPPLAKEDSALQVPETRSTPESSRTREPPPTCSNFNFLQELKPQSVSDLAVHPKKVLELESWLDQCILKPQATSTPALLLLTGPSGCGKTAATQVLCQSKSIGIHEWLNPINYYQQDFEDTGHSYENQADSFLQFVVESKFGNLFTGSSRNVCLVKEYPNIFLRDPQQFITFLEDIHIAGGMRVIFVATEDSGISTNIDRILFTDEVRTRFAIGTISFNACAVTLMKGAIKRAQKLVQNHPDLFEMPSNNVIEAICAESFGDIRCCINQFHLASLKGCVGMSVEVKSVAPTGTKRKRATNAVSLKSKLKDETLGLFHSIGRVLHPKIDPSTQRIHHNLGSLVDEFSTMPRVFLGFMHENYLRYFGDIDDAKRASTDLSLAQAYLEKWTENHELYNVGLYIAVMGLMLHNKHRVSMWNPIRAPRKIKQTDTIVSKGNLRPLPSTDACYYNLLVKKQKFDRFEDKL